MFKTGGQSFFVHGLAKNDKANVSAKELDALKQLANRYLSYSADEIRAAVDAGASIEVVKDGREDEE